VCLSGTGNGQHARLATNAIRSHLGLQMIEAGFSGIPFETPVHLDGAVALLDLAKQINGIAHVYQILIGEGHNLGQNWEVSELGGWVSNNLNQQKINIGLRNTVSNH